MDEIWKPIPGYEGLYDISSLGRIRTHHERKRRNKDGFLRQSNLRGYRTVVLCKPGEKGTKMVHRLAAMAFLGMPTESKNTVNHKNMDKSDNRIENLEWLSLAENIRHAAPAIRPRLLRGEMNRSKLTEEQVLSIRRRYIPKQVTLEQLAEEYGVSGPTVHAIVHRRKWAHLP